MLFLKLGISLLLSFHCAVAAVEATTTEWNSTTTALRGTTSHEIPQRQLIDAYFFFTCLGDTLLAGEELKPNESICVTMSSGETIHFGIFTSPMASPGYTMYQPKIMSSSRTYRQYTGIGTSADPGGLHLQSSDGHLVFLGNRVSGCLAMPGRSGGQLTIKEVPGNQLQVQVTDSVGAVVWRYDETECYPTTPELCFSVLHVNNRLGWKEYLCTYDLNGNVAYRFGLNEDAGLFGLWKGSSLIWRPDVSPNSGHVRGDYLHFQNDGHLTLYRDTTPKDYRWTTGNCVDFTANKLVLTSDGDVQEINHAGAIVWSLLGSQALPGASWDPRNSVPQLCMPQSYCVIPPTSPLFQIDVDVNIGDVLTHPGPEFAASCGPRCYNVKDSGDDPTRVMDPPYDPEPGDTFRFAYKEISADEFHFRAKVCGTKCDDEDWTWESAILGDTGLMVRESLDPMSKSLFAGHQPNWQASWSYRTETNGDSHQGTDGSPDVECLWVNLVRRSQEEFSFFFNYPDWDDDCVILPYSLVENNITIPDMPTTVLVGLAVSTGLAPPFCRYTEAQFSEIELLIE